MSETNLRTRKGRDEALERARATCTVDVVGIDPGDKHVGVAHWTRTKGMRSAELDAEKALPILDRLIEGKTALIIEKFVLYSGKAQAQSWSPMLTAQMIGALKWIAAGHDVPVFEQGADIKNATRQQCRARRLEWDRSSVHASDARLHLWHWLLRNEIIEQGERV